MSPQTSIHQFQAPDLSRYESTNCLPLTPNRAESWLQGDWTDVLREYQALGLQAILSIKLPWSCVNNQGLTFCLSQIWSCTQSPVRVDNLKQEIALAQCVLRSVFLQKSRSGKHHRASLIFLLLEFKRLSGFWSTARRSDLLRQFIFTEYLWCVYCLLYSYCSMAFPGPGMLPQNWGCSRSTSGTPSDTAYIYLYIWHVIDSSGENMKPRLWKINLGRDDNMSLTLLLQGAIVTASVAGQN